MPITAQQQQDVDTFRRVTKGQIGLGDDAADKLALQYSVQNGPQRVDTFGGPGGATWDEEVGHYRDTGAASHDRAAIQLDQTAADQARGLQMGSLGYLANQANGTAPSAAAIMSQRANQQAFQGAATQSAGAKSIGARIAGTHATGSLAGQQALAANAKNAALRAGEISQGTRGYLDAMQGARGQDIAAATTNANLDAQQRAMNEKRQQEYERRAQAARAVQLESGMTAADQHAKEYAAHRETVRNAAKSNLAAGEALFGTVTSMGTGMASAGIAKGARKSAPAVSALPKDRK